MCVWMKKTKRYIYKLTKQKNQKIQQDWGTFQALDYNSRNKKKT